MSLLNRKPCFIPSQEKPKESLHIKKAATEQPDTFDFDILLSPFYVTEVGNEDNPVEAVRSTVPETGQQFPKHGCRFSAYR